MPGAADSRKNPFADAVALWHMGEASDRAAAKAGIRIYGNAKLGVPLRGAEREASLRRGGDGKVAEFRGGYLIASNRDGQPLELTGSEMTLCLRVRDPEGKWDTPLFARQDPGDNLANLLYGAQVDRDMIGPREERRIREGKALEFLWRTEPAASSVKPEYFDDSFWYRALVVPHTQVREDFLNGVLRISAPVELIGPNQWHDVVVRFKGPNLELFIDGVLVDEEWPHGALYRFRGPFLIGAGYKGGQLAGGFHGQIDHVALWKRALGDDEITLLSGGKEEVARRDVEILGPASTSLQYWRPRGYNAFAGDCMPFWDGTRFHLFYLFDRRHGSSKWWTGVGGWAHASTKDLIHWEHHPMALPMTDPTECALGTGQCIYFEGKYYLFYIQHGRRIFWKDAPYQGDNIFVATSTDGINFQKQTEPVATMEYLGDGDINPAVFPDATGRRFFMNVSGHKVYSSNDLMKWQETAELPWLKDVFRGWICTSYFQWNDWYYFYFHGRYRMSREPMEAGRWVAPASQDLRDAIYVPQVAAFGANRYIWVGWGETDRARRSLYAQEIVFRELVQNPDGTLGMKWPAEMIPASGEPLKLGFEPLRGNATENAGAILVRAQEGFAVAMLKGLPQNVRITLRINPGAGVKHFGLTLRGQGNYEEGCELRFEPGRQRVQYGVPDGGGMAKDFTGPMVPVVADACIDNLTGLDRPFVLDLIVKDDLVDACIDGRRTIFKRQPAQGDRLFLFANQGDVVFEDISVRPLVGQ
jgi:hypothetical protein